MERAKADVMLPRPAQFHGFGNQFDNIQFLLDLVNDTHFKFQSHCHSERSEESHPTTSRFFVAKFAPQNDNPGVLIPQSEIRNLKSKIRNPQSPAAVIIPYFDLFINIGATARGKKETPVAAQTTGVHQKQLTFIHPRRWAARRE
jgi:hypothetical protein